MMRSAVDNRFQPIIEKKGKITKVGRIVSEPSAIRSAANWALLNQFIASINVGNYVYLCIGKNHELHNSWALDIRFPTFVSDTNLQWQSQCRERWPYAESCEYTEPKTHPKLQSKNFVKVDFEIRSIRINRTVFPFLCHYSTHWDTYGSFLLFGTVDELFRN